MRISIIKYGTWGLRKKINNCEYAPWKKVSRPRRTHAPLARSSKTILQIYSLLWFSEASAPFPFNLARSFRAPRGRKTSALRNDPDLQSCAHVRLGCCSTGGSSVRRPNVPNLADCRLNVDASIYEALLCEMATRIPTCRTPSSFQKNLLRILRYSDVPRGNFKRS